MIALLLGSKASTQPTHNGHYQSDRLPENVTPVISRVTAQPLKVAAAKTVGLVGTPVRR
jgi:hypothetical protein